MGSAALRQTDKLTFQQTRDSRTDIPSEGDFVIERFIWTR